MVHSGKVRAVEFGPRPKICVATFFKKFRVDANSYYLIDNNKTKSEIWQFARTEHDSKKKSLFGIDSRIDTTAKTTFTKTLKKRRKEL